MQYKKNGALRKHRRRAFLSPEIKNAIFFSLNLNIVLVSLIAFYIIYWLIKL